MNKKAGFVLAVILAVLSGRAVCAAEVVMPVRAEIIQCGERAHLEEACRKEPRCCGFLAFPEVQTPAAGQPQETAGTSPERKAYTQADES